MNIGPINSFGINAASSGGANATLTGGLVSAMAMSALLIGGAILSGGVFTEGDSGGQVSTTVSGGAYSDSGVGGKQFYTANLSGFIDSEGVVGSSLGIASGLNGGCYSPSGFGGELLCNTRLQMADTVGDVSFTYSGLIYSAGLSDGIFSNSWLFSNIVGSTLLITSGVFSDSVIGSELQRGTIMEGGFVSNQVVGGTYLYGAILSDGIPAQHVLGDFLQVGAVLQDGIIHVGEVGSPSMRISTEMDGGISSHTDFTAQILISVHGNSGVFSNQTLVGYLRKDEKLLGGVQSSGFSDSQRLLAAQRLQGGVASTSKAQGLQAISAALLGGLTEDSQLVGVLKASPKLQGAVVNSSLVDAAVISGARLSDGVTSQASLQANMTTSSLLLDGMGSDSILGGRRLVIPLLTGGVVSGFTVGGDIVQGFKDPLLNTWALSIASATPILSIETPSQDI